MRAVADIARRRRILGMLGGCWAVSARLLPGRLWLLPPQPRQQPLLESPVPEDQPNDSLIALM